MKKFLPLVFTIPLIASFFSLVFYLEGNRIFGVASLFLTLTLSTHTIYAKHTGTENARSKILKEVGVMVLTLVIILFLGGIAGMLANAQVSVRWDAAAGFISAIAVSFGVGYLVRKGMGRLVG